MRWSLAGLAFAALVGLAVATVSIKATNVQARARIESAYRIVLEQRVEHARRQHEWRDARGTAELRVRLADLLAQSSRLRDRHHE